VEWSWVSEERNTLFKKRFAGEAYALRAWNSFELLKNHGGLGEDGNMLGFIILDGYVEPASVNPNAPRSSYDDCVNFIIKDCDSALSKLPLDYADIPGSYEYNQVFGAVNKGRMSGRIMKALKSRVLLHAASPAFNTDNSVAEWERAALASADLLNEIGGLSGLSATGLKWYLNINDPDIIWRKDKVSSLSWETQNFPPSLYGEGRDNPSQNLVDAFPMANGYPIADLVNSGYDETNPYTGRDPRLSQYILYNGNTIGTNVINTSVESVKDGIRATSLSTVTGYYLKKHMHEAVKLTPGLTSSTIHFYTYFRYTETFLNYAEAANEAWGPDDAHGNGFSAREVMKKIRERAGIAPADAYLASIATKDAMRELIHNERRIELCFEGFRFWDIRRWNLINTMKTTAKGMSIINNAGIKTYSVIDVEPRLYSDFMIYPPIPYNEVIKSGLIQNKGWN